MNPAEARVVSCFRNVFPSLTEEEIRSAGAGSLEAWDSIAHVTLLSAIAEDFGLSFGLDDFESLTSFPAIVARVERAGGP
jgi:acyl carrier protein